MRAGRLDKPVRDDFNPSTITKMARRVGYLCSNPDCGRHTVGPNPSGDGSVNIGVGAHITAAAPGGPRYDPSLTSAERRHESNGILLCQTCAKLIDSDEKHYTVKLLCDWKRTAEDRALAAVAHGPSGAVTVNVAIELDEADRQLIRGLGLPSADDIETVTVRVKQAAKADIEAFKGTRSWPRHPVALNLRTRTSSGPQFLSVEGVARVVEIAEELSLVAAPGTGKTTTLTQVADAILTSGSSIALFVPLAEWSALHDSVFESLLHRNAFQAFRIQHFMLLAAHGRLVLLLDGWNELDPTSRSGLIYELKALRRDYPLLGVVISTRRQASDVPISGPMIEVDALSEDQQLEIARALRGEDGEALLDHAWRTPGVRELISIPLYLNALLSYATSGAMPQTKEEVLRLFVDEHERAPEKAETLQRELLGCHRPILAALAVEATTAANTVIEIVRARAVITDVENELAAAGQISLRPQPSTVLDVLVNHNTLVRADSNGVSFQHQQFQEWHASLEVEKLMLAAAAGDAIAATRLCAGVLDMPAWEESILFACERMSRDGANGIAAVAATVLRSLSIDPILAAEMIYRAGDAVWQQVKSEVLAFAKRWHTPGKADRAVRFMITAARSEFASDIWPLITNPDTQVHLRALRAARRFRTNVLGSEAATLLAAIDEAVRKNVLGEIASHGGMDGIELATSVAKTDPSASVQFAVIQSLAFRRADRHAVEILKVALPEVWTMLAKAGYPMELGDKDAAARLRREREAYIANEADTLSKIGMLLLGDDNDAAHGQEIGALIASDQFPTRDGRASSTVERAFERYPKEVGSALTKRLEAGQELPFHTDKLLEGAVIVDDGSIAAMVLESATENRIADVAAAIVGPKTVGALIDKFLDLDHTLHAAGQPVAQSQRQEYIRILQRIGSTSVDSFLQAILNRGSTRDPGRIGRLADLIARHGKSVSSTPLHAEAELLDSLARMVTQWINDLLLSSGATRHQFAEIVRVIGRLPRPEFVDGLRRFLVEDLARRAQARQAHLAGTKRGPLGPDVVMSYTLHYRQAFIAIGNDQIVQLMQEYLPTLEFGFDAACVLKGIWENRNGVSEEKRFVSWPDFSVVRARQEHAAGAASPFGEMIFAAIRSLIGQEPLEVESSATCA